MNTSIKIILISTALLTASGIAVAGRGQGCDKWGGGAQAMNGTETMRGSYGMKSKGMKQGGLVYQLDNLTDAQKDEITALRRAQHERMFNQREEKFKQRAEMKSKVNAILTEDQRNQLASLRSGNRF